MENPEETVTTIKDSDVHWVMEWGPQFPDKPPTELMFNDGQALARLLSEEVVFLNSHWFEKEWPDDARKKASLNVNCNDVFAWACADAEPMNYEDIRSVYDHWIKDKGWGVAKWCAIRRNEKPQRPVAEDMKRTGSWDDQMEALGDNWYDRRCRELAAIKSDHVSDIMQSIEKLKSE